MSVEEILEDFESLEDAASSVELTENAADDETKQTKGFLQLQDFRRPKLQEPLTTNRFSNMSRSYTKLEIKTQGFELKTLQREDSHQKISEKSFLLTEYIL